MFMVPCISLVIYLQDIEENQKVLTNDELEDLVRSSTEE